MGTGVSWVRAKVRPSRFFRKVESSHPDLDAGVAADEGSMWPTAARVGLLAVAAFLPAIACGWITTWDDEKNFLGNPQFRGLGWTQIAWAWKTTILGVYQPLCWMMLEAEYAAWGVNPKGYHIMGLALHGLVAAAVFALFVALLRRCLPDLGSSRPVVVRRSAAVAAAFWAVHPMRAEPVAWVSAQGYMPCTLCLIYAVLAYLRAHDPGRSARGRLAWSSIALALYAAAMLFKTVAVSLPLVLLVLDLYPLRRRPGPGSPPGWAANLARLGRETPLHCGGAGIQLLGDDEPYVVRAQPRDAAGGGRLLGLVLSDQDARALRALGVVHLE